MHLFCDFSRIFFDRLYIFFRNIFRRNNTCRISGMYSRKLDMFHNRRNKRMCAVADRVCFTFCCMSEETVDQNRTVRCHTDCCFHISYHAFRIIYNFHATAAKYIRRTHHNRITDLLGNFKSIVHRNSHSRLRHRNLKLIHHFTEQIAVFRQIDNRRSRT